MLFLEWGERKGLVPRGLTQLDERVLGACFRAMALADSKIDAGKGKV